MCSVLLPVFSILIKCFSVLSLKFQKNKLIKFQPHFNRTAYFNYTNPQSFSNLRNQKYNLIQLFTSFKCLECELVKKNLIETSKYLLVLNSSNVLLTNCDIYSEYCKKEGITKYPYFRVWYYNKNLNTHTLLENDIFSYEIEDLLEYIDKLSTHEINANFHQNLSNIFSINTKKDYKTFNENYGDISFTLIIEDNANNTNLLQIYNHIISTNQRYVSRFYFAYITSSKLRKYSKFSSNEIPPSILLSGVHYKDFNIRKKLPVVDYENQTEVDEFFEAVVDFIENNKYPVFKHFDFEYLKSLKHYNQTIFIFVITHSKKANNNEYNTFNYDDSVKKLITLAQNFIIERRDIIFGYLFKDTDKDLLSYFKVDNNLKEDNIIIYNFTCGKYYINFYNNSHEQLESIITDFTDGKIKYKSGYFIEDFLGSVGVSVNPKIIGLVFLAVFSLVVMVLFTFCIKTLDEFDNKKEDKRKRKRNKLLKTYKNN